MPARPPWWNTWGVFHRLPLKKCLGKVCVQFRKWCFSACAKSTSTGQKFSWLKSISFGTLALVFFHNRLSSMAPAIILQSGMNLCLTGQPQNLQQPKDPRVICSAIIYLGMDQYLLIPFLGGWTSIYQLFWCSPGYKVLTHSHLSVGNVHFLIHGAPTSHLRRTKNLSSCMQRMRTGRFSCALCWCPVLLLESPKNNVP